MQDQNQINIDVCKGVHYLENRALGLLLRLIFFCPKYSVKLSYVKYIFILTRFSSLKNNSSKWNFTILFTLFWRVFRNVKFNSWKGKSELRKRGVPELLLLQSRKTRRCGKNLLGDTPSRRTTESRGYQLSVYGADAVKVRTPNEVDHHRKKGGLSLSGCCHLGLNYKNHLLFAT